MQAKALPVSGGEFQGSIECFASGMGYYVFMLLYAHVKKKTFLAIICPLLKKKKKKN